MVATKFLKTMLLHFGLDFYVNTHNDYLRGAVSNITSWLI